MTAQSLSGVVGFRTSYDIPQDWGKLTAIGRVEYSNRLEGAYNQQLGYADLTGGQVYTVSNEAIASSSLLAGVGLRATVKTVDVDVEYDIAGGAAKTQAQTIRGEVRVGF
jgi:uncharacterized protein with beta-barrel porin domain